MSEFSVHRIRNDVTNQSVTASPFIALRFGLHPPIPRGGWDLPSVEHSSFPRLNPNTAARFRGLAA
jgi:hypothetical protein